MKSFFCFFRASRTGGKKKKNSLFPSPPLPLSLPSNSTRNSDDYILYCHPGKQKTPRSDRLREWYHVALRAAAARGAVAAVGNMYDAFFEGGRDHALPPGACSATHLPYFEGDYWPGEAENVLATMPPFGDGRGGGLPASSSSSALARPKPGISASSSRAKGPKGSKRGAGLLGPGSAASPDERLMARLGDVIGGMRDDFIVVHLRRPCSHCRRYPCAPEKMWVYPPPESEEEKEKKKEEEEEREAAVAVGGAPATVVTEVKEDEAAAGAAGATAAPPASAPAAAPTASPEEEVAVKKEEIGRAHV